MMRMVTALLIVVAAATAAVWAQTDPAEITPHAAPKAPAEAAPADTAGPPPAALAAVIFKSSCGRCHGSDRPAVGLSLRPENFADATIDVPSKEVQELKLVDTKNPEKSYLLMKIRGDEGIIGERMPIGSQPLGEAGIAGVEAWIHEVSAAAADTTAAAEPEAPEAPAADPPSAEPEAPEAPEAPAADNPPSGEPEAPEAPEPPADETRGAS